MCVTVHVREYAVTSGKIENYYSMSIWSKCLTNLWNIRRFIYNLWKVLKLVFLLSIWIQICSGGNVKITPGSCSVVRMWAEGSRNKYLGSDTKFHHLSIRLKMLRIYQYSVDHKCNLWRIHIFVTFSDHMKKFVLCSIWLRKDIYTLCKCSVILTLSRYGYRRVSHMTNMYSFETFQLVVHIFTCLLGHGPHLRSKAVTT